jgi:hypothetical protein
MTVKEVSYTCYNTSTKLFIYLLIIWMNSYELLF